MSQGKNHSKLKNLNSIDKYQPFINRFDTFDWLRIFKIESE